VHIFLFNSLSVFIDSMALTCCVGTNYYKLAHTCDCVDVVCVCRYIDAMCPGVGSIAEIDPNAVPTPKPRRERQRPGAPWFNDEIKKEKLLKRKV